MFNYPYFIPCNGNLTKKIINDNIDYNIKNNSMPLDSFTISKITSLVASNDTNDKLYFWQLYSILGEQPWKSCMRNELKHTSLSSRNLFYLLTYAWDAFETKHLIDLGCYR